MKNLFTTLLVLLLIGGAATGSTVARAAPLHADLVASGATLTPYIEASSLQRMDPLTEQQMAATKGELWPLVGAIGAIVAVDLALQSYFWGVYVPSVTEEPVQCTSCRAPTVRQ